MGSRVGRRCPGRLLVFLTVDDVSSLGFSWLAVDSPSSAINVSSDGPESCFSPSRISVSILSKSRLGRAFFSRSFKVILERSCFAAQFSVTFSQVFRTPAQPIDFAYTKSKDSVRSTSHGIGRFDWNV